MDKLTVLIADDEASGLDVMMRYLFLYFKDLTMLEIEVVSMAKLAIEKIKKRTQPYDLIMVDLHFESDEDKDEQGRKLNGNDIIIAAAQKFPTCHTRYFTVSGRKNRRKIQNLEQDIIDNGILITSLLKDEVSDDDVEEFASGAVNENVKKLRTKIDKELLLWTEYNLKLGITQTDKALFLNTLDNSNLTGKFSVFGQPRSLHILLIYWINKGINITSGEILSTIPDAFIDRPNIDHDKLFKNQGLLKFKQPLANYYQQFYAFHIQDLPALVSKAKANLDKLLGVYCICKGKYEDSLDKGCSQFIDQFNELHKIFRKEKLNVQGGLGDPAKEEVMIQFKKRIWVRLFCLGAYFLMISETDIFRLLGLNREITNDSNLKVFSRSLWLDDFCKSMDYWDRKYKSVFESLSHYEKEFLREWKRELIALKDDSLKELFAKRELDKSLEFIV